jgi:hypothetical protein
MSGTFRPLLPRSDGMSPADGPPEKPTRKRKAVTLACQRCRSHKAKCDGGRPACGTCSGKNLECEYDDDPNTTPHANLKREYYRLEREKKELLELYGMMKDRPEAEAIIILQRMRAGTDIQALLSSVKEADLVTQLQLSNVPTFPSRRSLPMETQMNLDHPHAYPSLLPLDDPKAGLGLKEKNILHTNPDDDNIVTREDVVNARSVLRSHWQYLS